MRNLILGTYKRRHIGQPVNWIVLTLPTDQCFVMLAEIESHATPDTTKVFFANAAFDEDRCHCFADVERLFGAERQRVQAALITLANAELQIVGQIVG
jgi:hypothetical protein